MAVSGVEESHTATASIGSKTAGTIAAAVDSVGHEVVKAVAQADVAGTAVSAAVNNMAHANTLAMCAAESAMQTCVVVIVLNSE